MAVKIGMEPVHPGGFIRRSVLPDDLSVTAAAGALGVGRPALSNLLNEKASLSPETAPEIPVVAFTLSTRGSHDFGEDGLAVVAHFPHCKSTV